MLVIGPKSAREEKEARDLVEFRRPESDVIVLIKASWNEGGSTIRPFLPDEIIRFEIVRESDPESRSIHPAPLPWH